MRNREKKKRKKKNPHSLGKGDIEETDLEDRFKETGSENRIKLNSFN